MRPLLVFTLLLSSVLPATAIAAEALNNTKLENAYIPDGTACLPGKDKKLPKGCETRSGSQAVTDKALRDAEQQNVNQALGNPQRNNPDIPAQPVQLPPPTIQQQNLLHYLESRKNQPPPPPAP